jgi:hypothetical protein
VVALATAFAIAGFFLWPGAVALRGPKASIAVLPFEAIGEDAFTRRLSQGITQDIVTDLARFREFDVIGHNSTTALGPVEDITALGVRLDVRYVLTGSHERLGGAHPLKVQALHFGKALCQARPRAPVDRGPQLPLVHRYSLPAGGLQPTGPPAVGHFTAGRLPRPAANFV